MSNGNRRNEISHVQKGDEVEVTKTCSIKSERRSLSDFISNLYEEILNIMLMDCANLMTPGETIEVNETKSRMGGCNLDESRTESEEKNVRGREEYRSCRLPDNDWINFNLNLNLKIKKWVESKDSEALLIDIISCPIRNLQHFNSTNTTSSSMEQFDCGPKRKRGRQDGEQRLEKSMEDSKEDSKMQRSDSSPSMPISEYFPYLTPIFFTLPIDMQIRTIIAITLKLKRYSISRLQLCVESRETKEDGNDIQVDEEIYFHAWETSICCIRVMTIAEEVMKGLVNSTDSQKITLRQYEVLMACVGAVSGNFFDFYQCRCQCSFSIWPTFLLFCSSPPSWQ